MLGERVARRIAQGRDPVILKGPLPENPGFEDIPSLREIASSIVYPLIIENQVLGVLCINRTNNPQPFCVADLRNATIFASQIAQAIYNANLYHQLEEKIQKLDEAYRRLRDTQSQLIRSEKLASIGQMAAGVAHELNNPLTSIIGFTQLSLREDDLSSHQRTFLKNIEIQGQRCSRIVLSLLKLSRREKSLHRPYDIVPQLKEMIEFARYDLTKNQVEIVERYEGSLPQLVGDGNQIQQVFLNLITNAIHAMDGRSPKTLEVEAARQGDRIQVRFRDTGAGIASENLASLFEPFFTTKPSGKGTGLGLFISDEIVRGHGGEIRVESRLGVGSTFTVDLPIVRDKASTIPAEPTQGA
jgi:signal transduction histidine kinase